MLTVIVKIFIAEYAFPIQRAMETVDVNLMLPNQIRQSQLISI